MKTEEHNTPEIEEAAAELGAPSQDESDDWSPEELSAEDRARYDKAVKAVDDFIARFPRYRQTNENREKILGFLSDHSLEISPAALALAYEQLESELDLAPDQDSEQQGQPDASTRLATALLARGNRRGEWEEDAEESEPEPEEPKIARGKPVGWRNGKAIRVGG